MKIQKSDYLKEYEGNALDDKTKKAKALETALDVRKFEIDTYWKRGTYFWALIGAAFVALFSVSPPSKLFENIVIANLGFLFSLAWYFVNRGSAAWQRNWEAQVDLLEDEIIGPLFKSVINRREFRFCSLAGPYAFSPSRINTILSLVVVISWFLFIIRDYVYLVNDKARAGVCLSLVDITITICAAVMMYRWGRSGRSDRKRSIDVRTREYS